MSTPTIPNHMLQHLEYLRNLHLEGPRIGNIYLEDTALLSYLETHPISKNQVFQKELERLGDRFATVYLDAARQAQQNHPRLEQFDSYGRRIDKLHLSEGWKQLGKYSSEDGIVAMAYEADRFNLKEHQRFGQLIALYMYHSSSGLYGCPLAMTDGAAYTLRNMDRSKKPHLEAAYQHLISRSDPWTSGQWMTEKKGGSDVSNTETLAVKNEAGTYNLYGYKWFTSATESQMSLGLGKIVGKDALPSASELEKTKVSLFFIPVQNKDGGLNRMEIIRLKDKLGTQQLPTAELLLKGT
jgi:alkylation response protein AidB-like acyl-CoA dehydrogenase